MLRLAFAWCIEFEKELCVWECASQDRPNLGDVGQEGRVIGSECYSLLGDIQTSMLGVHRGAYIKTKGQNYTQNSRLDNKAAAIWSLTWGNLHKTC